MLKILVSVLPEMMREREASGVSGQIRRVELFDVFMRQLFKREAAKQKTERIEYKSSESPRYLFQLKDSEENWLADYQAYCEELAAYMFKTGKIAIAYQQHWQLGNDRQGARLLAQPELDRFFSETDPATQAVRWSCPVMRQGTRYSFSHKLIYEYFLARRMMREWKLSRTPWKPSPPRAQRVVLLSGHQVRPPQGTGNQERQGFFLFRSTGSPV